jgi:hypothetical protein
VSILRHLSVRLWKSLFRVSDKIVSVMTYRKPVPCPCDWPTITTESDRIEMSPTGGVPCQLYLCKQWLGG